MNPNPALETAAAQLLASLDRKAALDPGYRWRLLGVVNLFNFSFTELGVRSHERFNVVDRISMSDDF